MVNSGRSDLKKIKKSKKITNCGSVTFLHLRSTLTFISLGIQVLFAHKMNFVSFERLETLPAGTKPRASHHRSLEERGVERGSARRSSLKGRERAIVNQTNIGTV